MKLFSILSICLVTLSSLIAQESTPTNDPNIIRQNYLLLTEKNNGGTFTLSPGEIVCVRFEDTETYTKPQGPNGSFVKNISTYTFNNASSDDYLQLTKNLTGLYPLSESSSSDALANVQQPQNKTTEKEWIFEAKASGTTMLTFSSSTSEVGYNGAPTPDFVAKKTIIFNIITKTD